MIRRKKSRQFLLHQRFRFWNKCAQTLKPCRKIDATVSFWLLNCGSMFIIMTLSCLSMVAGSSKKGTTIAKLMEELQWWEKNPPRVIKACDMKAFSTRSWILFSVVCTTLLTIYRCASQIHLSFWSSAIYKVMRIH